MAVLFQTGHDHRLRLAPIQADLENLSRDHGLQREPTANEVHRTWSAAEIELLINIGASQRQP